MKIDEEEYGCLQMSRRAGQAVVIDDEIEIAIMEVSGKQVRLSVMAPKRVRVRREDLPVLKRPRR